MCRRHDHARHAGQSARWEVKVLARGRAAKMNKPLKRCPGCGDEFGLSDFIDNPSLQAIGMQFEDTDFENNLYYFNHECPHCGSTMVVSVLAFLPLIDEPIPEDILAGRERCEGHCMRIDDLAACQSACKYAPFRRFLLKLRARVVAQAPEKEAA